MFTQINPGAHMLLSVHEAPSMPTRVGVTHSHSVASPGITRQRKFVAQPVCAVPRGSHACEQSLTPMASGMGHVTSVEQLVRAGQSPFVAQ